MQTSKRKILYFIDGPVPTQAQIDEAWDLGTSMFRNKQHFGDGDSIEHCDGVAGDPPAAYVEKYKEIVKAVQKRALPAPPAEVVAPPKAVPPPPPAAPAAKEK
jgi:hypothetical protein